MKASRMSMMVESTCGADGSYHVSSTCSTAPTTHVASVVEGSRQGEGPGAHDKVEDVDETGGAGVLATAGQVLGPRHVLLPLLLLLLLS